MFIINSCCFYCCTSCTAVFEIVSSVRKVYKSFFYSKSDNAKYIQATVTVKNPLNKRVSIVM